MLHRFHAVGQMTLIGSAALIAAVSLPAAATGLQDFAGTFVYAASAAERQAVTAAVDKAAQEFNPLIRLIARPRLVEVATPAKRMIFTVKGAELGIQKDSLPMRVTRTDGTPLTFSHDGKSTRMTRQLSGNSVTETVKADDGTRTLVYTLNGDGKTLTVASTIQSDKLKNPLRINATYQRSGR